MCFNDIRLTMVYREVSSGISKCNRRMAVTVQFSSGLRNMPVVKIKIVKECTAKQALLIHPQAEHPAKAHAEVGNGTTMLQRRCSAMRYVMAHGHDLIAGKQVSDTFGKYCRHSFGRNNCIQELQSSFLVKTQTFDGYTISILPVIVIAFNSNVCVFFTFLPYFTDFLSC